MLTPCENCPFRSDRPFYLRRGKAGDIVNGLTHDKDFACHKTVNYEGDRLNTRGSKRCVGAAIFMEKTIRGGMRSNVMFRLAHRSGELDPEKLSDRVPVYDSIDAFIRGTESPWE